ncbi:hypothetical protein ACRAVF_18940 [Bradyrhizobium oligotrophicum S58]
MAAEDTGAFTWGAGGARMTPEEIAQRRKDAAASLAQATDGGFAPGTRGAGVWTQGLAKVAKAVMAGLDYREADQASKANESENAKMIAALLGGGAAATPAAAAGGDTAAPVADASAPRGIRNNNPLNIEDGDFARSQPGYAGSDGRFAKFETPDHGTAAASNLIGTYETKHGLNTVSGIINRWAPTSDGNNTSAYAADVAKRLGVDPNSPLTPEQRPALIAAMGYHENGRPIPGVPGGSPAVAKVAGVMPAAVPAAAPTEEDPAAIPATAAPAAAASPAVAKVASALPAGVNPAVVQVMTSPYASPAAKQIASLMMQQQLSQQQKAVSAPYTDPNLGVVQKGADGSIHVLRGPQAGEAYKDADGNLMQKGPDGTLHPVIQADKPPGSVKEFEYYKTLSPEDRELMNASKKPARRVSSTMSAPRTRASTRR